MALPAKAAKALKRKKQVPWQATVSAGGKTVSKTVSLKAEPKAKKPKHKHKKRKRRKG